MPEGDKCFRYSEDKYTNNNNSLHYAESSHTENLGENHSGLASFMKLE